MREVNEKAFGGGEEAAIVEKLHAAGGVTLALVAEVDGRIVGHILFSPVRIDDEEAAVGLAPMAVLPVHQRQGVGSMLVRDGLERLRAAGHGAVVVVGHPEYYPRFGFEPASRFGLRWEHPCPDDTFMALELSPGFLREHPGVVRYRPEVG